MKALDYINKKYKRFPEVRKQYLEYYNCFKTLESLPLSKLHVLGNMAGLDMNHYKTKNIIVKGLIIRLSGGAHLVQDEFLNLL